MFSYTIDFGRGGRIAIILAVAAAIITHYPILTLLAVAFPFLAAKLLWRRNEPPILFLAFLLQWLQITIKIFYADIYNLPLEKTYEFPEHIVQAYCLSIFGLVVQCVGIWLVLRKLPSVDKEHYANLAQQYNLRRVTIVYVLAIFLYPVLTKFSFSTGGFQQVIQKLTDLKWSLFFLLYIYSYLKEKDIKIFYLIILAEIALSFSGYFSSFKDFFMFYALAYVMLNNKFGFKQYIVIGLVALACFNLFVVWQHVKPEYRRFLSGGAQSQNITVSRQVALQKLVDLVRDMDTTGYQDGVTRLVDRTSYIDFFSASIGYVPKRVVHEKGRLWWGALTHIFTPRILFPNKPAIDDSGKTSRYTGLKLAGAAEGTSITLGYMGESYVDFGFEFMFVPLFFFGLLVGFIYKYILQTSINRLWGIAFLFPIFFQLQLFEVALDKMLGGIIAYFIVLIFIRKWGIPYLDKFLKTHPAEVRLTVAEA